jgi:hypothetical protein
MRFRNSFFLRKATRQENCESSMISLQQAKDDNDTSRVMFYEMAVCNLFKELQSMEE